MLKRSIAGSSSRSIPNFLRNLQIDFQSVLTLLRSHQQWRSVPLYLHPHQHVLSPEFLNLSILIGLRWNLRVILIWISLMTKNAEHFFRCFSAIQDSYVLNYLFSFITIYVMVMGFLGVQLLEFFKYFYISRLQDVRAVKMFFPICMLPISMIYKVI